MLLKPTIHQLPFPSIGCGQLNIDKNVIANEMLVEAQNQVFAANILLRIVFVILPEQIEVFEAFKAKLKKSSRRKNRNKRC